MQTHSDLSVAINAALAHEGFNTSMTCALVSDANYFWAIDWNPRLTSPTSAGFFGSSVITG